jgi:iron complex transport system ATP-binding protein
MVEKARSIALEFGLDKILDRPFGLLSSGERQRTLLARAAMTEPSLLVLDEPVSNLDMGAREKFLAQVSHMAASLKPPTIILTTHAIQEIGPFVTHVFMIKEGKLVAAGPIETTLTQPNLAETYDLPLKIEKTANGRYLAYLD